MRSLTVCLKFIVDKDSKSLLNPIFSPRKLNLEEYKWKIEQPLWLKIGGTVGGLALIGGELWWFLGNNKQNR